jgi:hypothetical protein
VRGGDGVTVDPRLLTFPRGTNKSSFIVTVEDTFNSTDSTLAYALSGTNSDSFKLQPTQGSVKIGEVDNDPPKLIFEGSENETAEDSDSESETPKTLTKTVDRTEITLAIEADEIGTAYWMLLDPGSWPTPTH